MLYIQKHIWSLFVLLKCNFHMTNTIPLPKCSNALDVKIRMTKCGILELLKVFQISPLILFENGFAAWFFYTTPSLTLPIKANQIKTVTYKLATKY